MHDEHNGIAPIGDACSWPEEAKYGGPEATSSLTPIDFFSFL